MPVKSYDKSAKSDAAARSTHGSSQIGRAQRLAPRDAARAASASAHVAHGHPPTPLRQARFVLSAHELEQLPPDRGAEIAFAGRSNAGKSSALNAICDQVGLARTSKTPGRTQQLNVFALAGERRLIDLPGYGYAKVPEKLRDHWRLVIDAYLHQRESLRGVVLIIDARHPLKEFDRDMLTFCRDIELACHCLLTKADKLSRNEGARTLDSVRKELAAQAFPASAQLFSAPAKTGLDQARAVAMGWLAA